MKTGTEHDILEQVTRLLREGEQTSPALDESDAESLVASLAAIEDGSELLQAVEVLIDLAFHFETEESAPELAVVLLDIAETAGERLAAYLGGPKVDNTEAKAVRFIRPGAPGGSGLPLA